MTITLRPYQTAVARAVSMQYQAEGRKAVLLQMPTGAGKTRTAAFIVEKYTSTGRTVLWLVHREELLMQAAMTFAEYGVEHHMVCAASSERAIKAQQFREHGRSFVKHGARLIIASIQTIVRRLESLDWLKPDQIIADECHLSLAATWRRVLDHWKDARLLGLTATPARLDGQSFDVKDGGLYETMVLGPRVADLIDMGNLARFDAYAPPVELVQGVANLGKRKGGDFDTHELEKELDAPKVYGDVVGHYRRYSDGKPAIAFCPTIKTAQKFAEAFREAGYRAIALDGDTDDTVRRQALQQLGRGELDVVTSVSILVEGTDVPFATTALMLRRTESLSLYLQAVGRVLRPHPQKDRAIILDFVGVIDLHGLPDEDREWTLRGKPVRHRAANDNAEDVPIRTCPKCHGIFLPSPVCPNPLNPATGEPCGYVYPVKERREAEQVDCDLQKITSEEMERRRKLKRAMQGQAQTVEELMGTMRMSRAQATKIIQARQAKADLVGDIVDALHAFKDDGGNVFATFGCTIGAVGKMKPKELKALRQKIADHLQQQAA
jgi:DNA repair protein RadD